MQTTLGVPPTIPQISSQLMPQRSSCLFFHNKMRLLLLMIILLLLGGLRITIRSLRNDHWSRCQCAGTPRSRNSSKTITTTTISMSSKMTDSHPRRCGGSAPSSPSRMPSYETWTSTRVCFAIARSARK